MNPYLLSGLEMTPKLIEREVRAFRLRDYDQRPDPTRFTMREVIAHLADWEPIFVERMKTGVENPGAAIKAYDEGKRAVDQNYAAKEPADSLAAWRKARAETIAYLQTLKPEDFQKTVNHPERGVLQVADIANMILGHDIYHLEQLASMPKEKVVDTW